MSPAIQAFSWIFFCFPSRQVSGIASKWDSQSCCILRFTMWRSKVYTSYNTTSWSSSSCGETTGIGTGSNGKSGKSWISRRATKKHLSLAKFWNCAEKSSTFTWLKSESIMSAFNAKTEMLSEMEKRNCSEILLWSSSQKNSNKDLPDKSTVVRSSMEERWRESLEPVLLERNNMDNTMDN